MKSCTFATVGGEGCGKARRVGSSVSLLEKAGERERERKRQTSKVPVFTLATGSKFLFITAPTSLLCLKRLFLPSFLEVSSRGGEEGGTSPPRLNTV